MMILSRTSLFKSLFFVVATLAIAACGGSGGSSSAAIDSDTDRSNAPAISQILADIRFIPQEYGGITTITPFQSIKFYVEADVIDPQGLADIEYIDVKHPDREWYWPLYQSENYGPYRENCRYGDSNTYGCIFHDPESPHSIPLKGWVLIAQDKAGNETVQHFDFKLPSGLPASSEQFVYSKHYFGNTENGLAMLGQPKDVSISTNSGTQSFEISFTIDDSRTTNYDFEFWVADESYPDLWVFAGFLGQDSPSIASSALVQGLNVVNVPWSEIELEIGYAVNDIDGLHVTAFDEPEVISRDYSWFNYLSVSDFVDMRF